MNTITTDMPEPGTLLRSYGLEAKYEFLRALRTPMFAVPTLLFPALFYVLFGIVLSGSRGGVAAAQYLLATYGVFGVIGASLFGFGVSVAIERENGYLELKRALPMPPGAYLLAKMAMAVLFSAIISVMLAVLAAGLAKVSLAPWQWLALFLVNLTGALPFCAIGLYVGSLVGGSGAPAVVNLLHLPMAFLSGLWMPLHLLSPIFAKLAPLWPAWHLGQLALKVVGRDSGASAAMHVAVLLGLTVVFFLLARRRLSR
ncbi:ABC transporter permease [Lysobacter sp. LF1]|uniref:ABC transporter permease n=1 Tax=Lysobacter stagni TaxID=3045172 RepID=A0ABT6XEH1_9GAMM|nr:ABC transporter permease [Lysobacter sp. LF1]MDI9238542.1 ABC transporter permease [Lysobacter sp. LF1]